MERFDKIPKATGLFWYFENGKTEPEPVKLDIEKHPEKFKGFNGRIQAWLREGEFLIGPQQPPPKQKGIANE